MQGGGKGRQSSLCVNHQPLLSSVEAREVRQCFAGGDIHCSLSTPPPRIIATLLVVTTEGHECRIWLVIPQNDR